MIAGEKSRAYSGRSLRMSDVVRKADTNAENELQDLVSSIRPSVSVKFNERIAIEGGRPGSGYIPDVLIEGFLVLEAEGKGSASADNERRDQELRKLGLRVVHLSNRIIHDPDGKELIYQLVILAVELHSTLVERRAAR